MLVLSRKKDERIIIGDTIELMVIEIRGDKVRLGIAAPREVSVHREEVYNAIKRDLAGASAEPMRSTGHTRTAGDGESARVSASAGE